MRFENQIAVVTGAGRGIGHAIAVRLASEGACVALVDRNDSGLAEVVAQLPDTSKVWYRAVDISREEEVQACVNDVFIRFGRIDAMCNNAGISGGDYSAITDTDTSVWQQILAVS